MGVVMLLLTVLSVSLCTRHYAAGSKIEFGSTPTTFLHGLSDTLTLRCDMMKTSGSASIVGKRDVTQTTEDVSAVTSIVIMKGGQDIASIGQLSPAHVMDGSNNSQVTGSVSKTVGDDGFLQLRILNPTTSQIGEYTCESNALDQAGHNIVFSTSVEVTASTPTTADLISYIHSLKQKVDTAILFSAALTIYQTVPAGSAVIYDQVFSNVGNAYNVTTGEFVCPIAGYYQFDIHALGYDDDYWLDLMQNDQSRIAVYGAPLDYQGSSNTAILKLQVGDVVKVVARQDSYLYDKQDQIYTTFSGHLLTPIV